MLRAAILGLAMQAAPQAAEPTAAPPQELAAGVYLLPSTPLEGRGPDGNSVIFDAPEGLIVVDTGRHTLVSDAILGFAQAHGRPITAIFNTHWHLDHSSGNGRLKAVFPQARVYTTNAVDRALGADGFLTRDAANIPTYLASPELSDTQKDEVRIFAATMERRDELRPDVVVSQSGPTTIAGRTLDVRVTDRAVTDADIWIYDAASGVAVIGDLVTMPVPYFETACPQQWRGALDDVMRTPFTTVIPGHGPAMSREQFNTYRVAFGRFIDCVNSEAAAAACGDIWGGGIAPLLNDPARQERVSRYVEYYVGMLRENGGKSRDCLGAPA